MAIVKVEFKWEDSEGDCYDCGRPAAYRDEMGTLYCSVDAAYRGFVMGEGPMVHLFTPEV